LQARQAIGYHKTSLRLRPGGTGFLYFAAEPTMLNNGVPFLMIPGPTTLPAEVLRAMHRPAIDIYDGPLLEVTDSCHRDLKQVFRTRAGHVYIYIANGHGAWDAALGNTLSRGDKVLVLDSGRFAREWGKSARGMGLVVEELTGDWRAAVDVEAVRRRLEADRDGEIKAVLVVQVDTASGVVNDVPALRRAIDAAGHKALFMVDVVASLGCMKFEMDDWGVDVAVGAAQKGLMTPAGLAFVAAGPRAHQAAGTANLKTHYIDWQVRHGEAHYQKYCGTPPEQHLFALRAALDMILAEGLEAVWHRHAVLAEAIRAALSRWAEDGEIALNIVEPAQRSNAVTVFRVAGGKAAALRDLLGRSCNVNLGLTIGEIAGEGIRIGHMGHINAPMVLGTLACIEAGFSALGIRHGAGGTQAAVDVIGRALAEA
jgi:alanine-glyoxylate transaminase/serine-glyoxylate transaminase/serine-pyruvate transaminase